MCKILIYEISYITLIGAKPLCNRFDKVDGFMMELNISYYMAVKHMTSFKTGLDIL